MPETVTVDRPDVRLRPGVVYPDWSVVTSDAVVEALTAFFDAFDLVRRWSAISEVEDRLRRVILEHYGAAGRPPSARQMSSASGLAPGALGGVLAGLEARDMVLLDDDGGVAGAYPFTEDDTAHRVTLDGRTINTMCAIDALGVGAMYDRDVVIASRCLECGGPIHVETHDRGQALKRYTPARTVVWLATRLAADGCAAKSACKSMAFFCSDDHLASWREDGGAAGFRLSIDEGLQAGRALFQPLLAPARPD